MKFKDLKIFKSKKARLITLLSTVVATLSAALVISTVSWFSAMESIQPDDEIEGAILTSYFDHIDGEFDESVYPHGCAANPYVITRPVHFYNLVRLQEGGEYGFDNNTYFQFGKTNIDGTGNTEPLFYEYNNDGVIQEGEYTPYLNMTYYSGVNALAPIGSARHPFESHIIGNKLTVQNLNINGSGLSDIGIFGYVASNAVINDLYFQSPRINANNAYAAAPGSIGHASHATHVYIGYLAGHVYNPNVFYNVYLNDCVIYNTTGNEYEMINTYGYFGHTDEPLQSTSDSSSYTSQLVAPNAYEALAYTYSTGYSNPLARRYTSEVQSGNFSGAVSSSNEVYTIGQKDNSGTKPYSLSSIGYSSGDAGSSKYIRYIKNVNGEDRYVEINDIEQENILTDKPAYIEYRQDEWGNPLEPIDHSSDPEYDFYGMSDGSYIFYDKIDEQNGQWKYAEVTADTTRPSQGAVSLNCFTISYEHTVNGVTKTFFLKYQAGSNGSYDTLVPEEWGSTTPPQEDKYYFCFKTSFGSDGVSRFTECGTEAEYYIYSPVGQKYLCTYAPQNVHSSAPVMDENLVHTPIFVPETGIQVAANKKHMPMKFTIGGPKTQITYDSFDNKYTGDGRNVNDDFDDNAGRTAGPYKGALQGSNITNGFWFGGHKMTADCVGGFFTIGDYIENQTTTLNNAINYRLTSNSSEIVEDSTLVIAGYKGEQTNTYSLDYAMATQTQNNRAVLQVKEVRDSSGYVLNETTGVAKLVVKYVEGQSGVFTLFDGSGYLCFPKGSGVFTGGTNTSNWLRTYDYDVIHEAGHEARIPYSQWRFSAFVQSGYYTRYRFQNVGDPDRYLCYNIGSNIFATYSLTDYETKYETTGFDNNNVNEDPNTGYPNARCWFYIYKQQYGQTIQNVHFTVARKIDIQGTVYPFKNVTYYDLLGSDQENSPTDYSKYTNFTVNPSFNVYFDTQQSQVQYFDALIEVWKRVNLISELHAGDTIMFAAKTGTGNTPQHYFMGSQATNYRNRSSSVNFTPPYVKAQNVPSNAVRFTLAKSDRGWRFDTGNGFLYAASSSSDYLRTESSPDNNGNADWSISITTDGNATVAAQGNYSHKYIRYYNRSSWYSSSGYFTCFSSSSSNTAIQIYKLAQSSADRATYVGDLINNFEPDRMDAVGPNIQYYSTYMKMNQAPSIIHAPVVGERFYPSVQFKNAITLMIDNNGSRDLGTLTFECTSTSTIPYFKLHDNSTEGLVEAGAVDTSPSNDAHSYLLNINAMNIDTLAYAYIKGVGDAVEPYTYCTADDPKMTKYLVILGAASDVHITNVTFTFNSVPGNIGYGGKVDYRSASYNATTGAYNGSVAGGNEVDFSALSIYIDVTNTGQKINVNVTFTPGTNGNPGVYTVTVDSTGTVLTQDLVINFFKYDNNLSELVVVVNNVSTTYYTGTVSVTIPANSA